MRRFEIMVETPKGCREKYNYDPQRKLFRFKKALPLGMVFPYDFGFIPHTRGEDGDPLDALIISEFVFFPGCIVMCRLVGAITAEQAEKKKKIRNDRFLFVAEESVQYEHVKSVTDLPEADIEQLQDFFINYNKAEGKTFTTCAILKTDKSFSLIKKQQDAVIDD
jgi:inorganic pyrophosphatase